MSQANDKHILLHFCYLIYFKEAKWASFIRRSAGFGKLAKDETVAIATLVDIEEEGRSES